ncbi:MULTISPECIES: signal recognition particle-docking protein FtsY [unclassified Crossiella]|uniref:signal recognition particle-docking protein FtsY n=1 Tax=unclassified Crossiella TaxID=2620835 RepID=UPI001FFEB5C9|nr:MULTISPECIES: signal recognition particle-docking protein FtsY [unclassified Crossiella]MCK2242433.1 signal recognition particle-docking protein FtsY [Crossiella sp. S99.2]MCK2254536.1 signal recognition particle-docking protein FtsY [Crossiella sp. S99.1]
MSTEVMIWIAVAVAAVLLVALVTGIVLARRRRVSIAEQAKPEVPARSTYQADSKISFAPGTDTATAPTVEPGHPVVERTEVDGQPGVGDDAAVPRDTPRRDIVDVPLPPAAEAPAPIEPVVVAETRPAPEEIAPTAGRLERLRGRLVKSRSAFGQGLLGLLGAGDLDEDSWTEVEDTLLLADLGAATTAEIIDRLRKEIVTRGVRTPEAARAVLREVLVDALKPEMDRSVRALPHDGRPAVLLITGVNGTGKTTTTGKLARVLVGDGRTVILGAADTFRAAAAEQLATWAERAGAEIVRGKEGADPASVAFDAVKRGVEAGVDAVLVDTAGRLHTKTGLMDELGKVKRVVEKQAKVDEVLLVLDATTGQNGLTQARVFSDVVEVTGIVLTKLDGTAKGGIVFQVQRELGVPVKLVGLGEGPDDLAPFAPGAFVDALLT